MTRFEIDINKAHSLLDLSNALQDISYNNYDINFNQLVTIKESVLNDGTFFKDFKQDMCDNIFIDPVRDNCNNYVETISHYHDIKLILPKLGIDDVSSTELQAENDAFITPFIYKSYTDGMFTNTDRDYKNLIEIKSDSQDISSIEIDVSYILQEDNIPRTDISFKELRENIDGEEMIGTIQFLRISGFKITRGDSEVIIYGTTIKYNAIIGYTIQNLWHNSLQDIENLHWTRRWQKLTYNIGLYNKNIDLIINESNKYLFPIIFPIIDDERILILPSLDKSIFIALITYNNNQYITSFEDESKYNIFKDLWENFNNNPSIDNIPFIYINVHELYITITNKLLNYPLLKIDDNSELVELDNVFYNYNINLENYDVSYQRTRSLSQIEYLKFQTSDTSYVEMVNIQSLMLLKHFIFDPNGSTDTGFYYKRSGFDIHLNVFAWRANIQDILYATHFHYTGNRYYHNTLWYNSDINILSLSSDIENLKNPMKIKLYTTQDNDYHKMNYELSNLNEYEISGGLYFKTDGGDTNLTYNYTKYIFSSTSSQFFISNHSLFNYNRYNLYVFSIISRSTNNPIYSSSEWITHIFSTYYNEDTTNVKTLSIMKTDQLILSKLEIIYNDSTYATKNAITPDYTTLEFHILLNSLPVPMNITDYFSIFYEHMLMFVDTIGKVYLTSTYDLCSNYITDVSIALNDISDNFYDAVYTTGEILYSIYFLNETSFNDIESFTTLNNGIINIISEFRNTIFENTIEPYEEVLNENNDQVSISESLIYSYQIYHRNRYNFSYDIFVHFKNINRTKYIYIEFIPKHISTTVLNEYTKVETNDSYNDLLDILLNVKNESNYDNIHIYFIMSIDRFQAYINNKPNILREGQMDNANLHYILYYHKDRSYDEANNNFLDEQHLSTIQPQYIFIDDDNHVVQYKNIQSHILLHLYLFSKLEIDKIDVNLNDITQTDIYPLHIDYNSIDGKYVTYKINHHIHILPVEMHNITQSSISDNHAIYFMKNNHKLDFDTTDENKKFRINKDDETSDFKDIIILQLDQPPFDYDKEISDIFASEDDKIYNHAYVTLYSINKNLTDSVDQFFNTIKYITDNNTKSYYNLFNHNDFTNIIYEFEFEYNKHYMQDRITEINYFETDEDTFVFLRMEPKSDYILDACLETNNNDLIIPEDYYYIKIGYHSICLFKDIRTIEFDVNLPDENIYPSKDVCGNDILRINPSTTDTFGIYPMIENYIMYNICIDISCIEYWNKSENNDSLSFFISILKEFKSQFTVYIDCSGATCDVFYDNFDGGICKVKIKQNAINNYHIESFHIPNHFDNKTIYLISSMNGIPFASQHMDVSITPNDSNTQPNISFDYKHAGTISVITLDDANRQFEITSTNTLTEITLQNYIINMRNLYNNIIRDSSNHIIDVSNSKFYIETVWKENIERVYGGFVLGFERFKQFKSQIYIGLVHMEYYRRVHMILSSLQLYRFSVDYIDYLQNRLDNDLDFPQLESTRGYFSIYSLGDGVTYSYIQKLITEIENLDVSTNTYPRKDIDGYYDNVLDYESKSKELYETSRNKRYNYVSQLKLKTNEKKLLLQQDNIIPISMKNSLSILERKYISISETLNSLKSEIDKAKALLFLRHIKYRSILNDIIQTLLTKIKYYMNGITIVDDIDTFLVDCFKDDKYFTHLDKFKIYKEFIRLKKYVVDSEYLYSTYGIYRDETLKPMYSKLGDNTTEIGDYSYDGTIDTVFAFDLPYAMEFSDFGVGFYEQNVIKDLENTYSSVLKNNHSSSSSPSSPPPKYYDPYNPINEDFGSNDYIQKNKDAFGQYINLLGYLTRYHTILGNYTTSPSAISSDVLGDICLNDFYNSDEKTLGNNDYTLGDKHRLFISYALHKTINIPNMDVYYNDGYENMINISMYKDDIWQPVYRYERRRYLGYHIENYKYAEIIEDYNEYWEESTSKNISFIQNYQKSAKNMVYLASCIYKYISKFDMTDKLFTPIHAATSDIINQIDNSTYRIIRDDDTIKNTYKSMYPYLIDTLQEIYFNIPDKNIGKDSIFESYDINLKYSTSDYADIISYPLNTYRLNIDTVIENIYYIDEYNIPLYNSYITGFRNTEITLKNSYDSISGDYRDIVDICSNFDALMHNAGIVIDKISGYDYIQEYLAFPKDDLSMQVIYGPSLIESYSEWDLSINDLMDTQKDIIYEIEIRQNKLNNNHLDDTEMIYPLDYDSNEDPIMNDYDINTLSYTEKLGYILTTLKTVFMTIKEIDDYQYDKYIHFISSISETISHVLYFIQNNEFRDNLNSLFETVDNYATHIILIMRTSISQSYITNPHKLKNDTMFNIDYGTMFTNPTFSIEDEHIGTTFIIIGNNIKFIKDYIFNYIIDICSNTYTQTDMDFSGIFVLHETIEVFNYSFELIEEMGDNHKYKTYHKSIISTYFNLLKNGIKFVFEKINGYIDADSITYNDYNTIIQSLRLLYRANNKIIEIIQNIERVGYKSVGDNYMISASDIEGNELKHIIEIAYHFVLVYMRYVFIQEYHIKLYDDISGILNDAGILNDVNVFMDFRLINNKNNKMIKTNISYFDPTNSDISLTLTYSAIDLSSVTYKHTYSDLSYTFDISKNDSLHGIRKYNFDISLTSDPIRLDISNDESIDISYIIFSDISFTLNQDRITDYYKSEYMNLISQIDPHNNNEITSPGFDLSLNIMFPDTSNVLKSTFDNSLSILDSSFIEYVNDNLLNMINGEKIRFIYNMRNIYIPFHKKIDGIIQNISSTLGIDIETIQEKSMIYHKFNIISYPNTGFDDPYNIQNIDYSIKSYVDTIQSNWTKLRNDIDKAYRDASELYDITDDLGIEYFPALIELSNNYFSYNDMKNSIDLGFDTIDSDFNYDTFISSEKDTKFVENYTFKIIDMLWFLYKNVYFTIYNSYDNEGDHNGNNIIISWREYTEEIGRNLNYILEFLEIYDDGDNELDVRRIRLYFILLFSNYRKYANFMDHTFHSGDSTISISNIEEDIRTEIDKIDPLYTNIEPFITTLTDMNTPSVNYDTLVKLLSEYAIPKYLHKILNNDNYYDDISNLRFVQLPYTRLIDELNKVYETSYIFRIDDLSANVLAGIKLQMETIQIFIDDISYIETDISNNSEIDGVDKPYLKAKNTSYWNDLSGHIQDIKTFVDDIDTTLKTFDVNMIDNPNFNIYNFISKKELTSEHLPPVYREDRIFNNLGGIETHDISFSSSNITSGITYDAILTFKNSLMNQQ